MTTRFKKKRKKHDHASAGHDPIGKHWKHLSGCRNADGMHHHHILFDKYHPSYFGKVGMCYFHRLYSKFHCPAVNVERLWFMVLIDKTAEATWAAGKTLILDVTQFGYTKVLGKGVLPPERPIVIKAKLISKVAEKKIKEARSRG